MNVISKNKRLLLILAAVPTLLLIPLIGMQFSTGIDWNLLDFAVMGTLLIATGLMVELVLRKISGKEKRLATLAIVAIVFVLIWAELAVGIFGTPFAGS